MKQKHSSNLNFFILYINKFTYSLYRRRLSFNSLYLFFFVFRKKSNTVCSRSQCINNICSIMHTVYNTSIYNDCPIPIYISLRLQYATCEMYACDFLFYFLAYTQIYIWFQLIYYCYFLSFFLIFCLCKRALC